MSVRDMGQVRENTKNMDAVTANSALSGLRPIRRRSKPKQIALCPSKYPANRHWYIRWKCDLDQSAYEGQAIDATNCLDLLSFNAIGVSKCAASSRILPNASARI